MTRVPRGTRSLQWRRQRQQKSRRWPLLNLVALMDVFTILVFFFLAHSSDAGTDAANRPVDLPEARVDQLPRETPVIVITPGQILLQGVPVLVVSAVRADGKTLDEQLVPALQALDSAGTAEAGQAGPADLEVTIMGDRSIPFTLLNKVMLACNRAGYGRIALSVIQKAAPVVPSS